MPLSQQRKIEITFGILRQAINQSGYGGWVRDKTLLDISQRIVGGIDKEEERNKSLGGSA